MDSKMKLVSCASTIGLELTAHIIVEGKRINQLKKEIA